MNLLVNAVQKYGSLQQVTAPDKHTSVPKIQQQPIKDTFEKSKDETSVSIFYMNDFHGQNIRMERAYSALKQFDNGNLTNKKFFTNNENIDKLKFASGDMFLGEDISNLKVDNEFLNIGGIMAITLGNHECDLPTNDFVKILENKKYKLLGANIHPSTNNQINKILTKSYIQECNGNKYGVIGLVPMDLPVHVKIQEHLPDLNISSNIESTLNDLQKEVDELQKQGIDKIILLSHLGLKHDKVIASKITGIDVILGAHTHNVLEGIKTGENLYTSKDGAPIVITQAGRDGEHFGVLNLKFNDKGEIISAQNNVGNTEDFHRDLYAKQSFEKILGKPEVVGNIKSVSGTPNDLYYYENPNCDFMLDALRNELHVDIALMNAANIRGKFDIGPIDTRSLMLMSPFANHIAVINASEKEIVDAIINRVERSTKSSSHRPGILQVSGLKYEFNKKGNVTKISFINKEGKEEPIDIKNPRTDKMYTVASDDFCITNKEMGLNLAHRYDNAIKKFDEDKDKFTATYIKHLNKPIDIKPDGRIKIVD